MFLTLWCCICYHKHANLAAASDWTGQKSLIKENRGGGTKMLQVEGSPIFWNYSFFVILFNCKINVLFKEFFLK